MHEKLYIYWCRLGREEHCYQVGRSNGLRLQEPLLEIL